MCSYLIRSVRMNEIVKSRRESRKCSRNLSPLSGSFELKTRMFKEVEISITIKIYIRWGIMTNSSHACIHTRKAKAVVTGKTPGPWGESEKSLTFQTRELCHLRAVHQAGQTINALWPVRYLKGCFTCYAINEGWNLRSSAWERNVESFTECYEFAFLKL